MNGPAFVRLDAPAKINLRLRVLERMQSGYHALESVFAALALADTVEVSRSARPGVELRVEGGVDTGPPERNLVYRAAVAFHEAVGAEPAVCLGLTKRIPSAAGLGGGSSDAAATLRALNLLNGRPLGEAALLMLGARLGSDVPFFLLPTPYALGWGRGERLLSLPTLPARPALVAHPGVPMPTGAAFARLAELRGAAPPDAWALPLAEMVDWTGVARHAANDFERPAFETIPSLAPAVTAMREAGAELALLAGSGASIFGVFMDEDARDAAGASLARTGLALWKTETLGAWPEPVAG